MCDFTSSRKISPPFTKKRDGGEGGRQTEWREGLGRVALTETGKGLKKNLLGIFLCVDPGLFPPGGPTFHSLHGYPNSPESRA